MNQNSFSQTICKSLEAPGNITPTASTGPQRKINLKNELAGFNEPENPDITVPDK